MKPTQIAAVGAAVLLAGAIAPVSAQDSKDRTVEQYSCKDIMRESGANRDVAIAFLRGLGKSGSTKFNLDVLHKQSDDFIERCLTNPDEKAMDAMAKIVG
jgi:HdeA/HdeB family